MAKNKGRGRGKKKKKQKAGKPYIPAKSNNIYAGLESEELSYLTDDQWDEYYFKGSTAANNWFTCHSGNTKVLSSGKNQGGSLFIGGWSRGAEHTDHMTVIDLTADKLPPQHRGTYYSILIDDFSVPQWSSFFWESMAMTIFNELSYGDVLIACQGGHGRSGMFTAIMSYILKDKRYIKIVDGELLASDPIAWIRKVHCKEAVETISQEICVYETCIKIRESASISEALEEVRSRPRFQSKPAVYGDLVAEWVDEPEDDEVYICPICMEEYGNMMEALMCCNTTHSIRYCPVCLTKHDYAVEAFNCCRVAPPYVFDEDEEID